MNEQHPLTEEMMDEIEMKFGGLCSECDDSLNMRAAYDLAIENVWKLWNDLTETAETDYKLVIRFHSNLCDMRPQQQENN